jgi:preprotein translocase, SecE subunit, bacterial
MGEVTNSTAEKAPKRSWFDGLKAEFNKIVWPDREALVKSTVAVITVTIILGVMIFVLDTVFEYGMGFIIG